MENADQTTIEKAKLKRKEYKEEALHAALPGGGCISAFFGSAPSVEKYIVDTGVQIIKFWLEVGDEEQKSRFEARIEDPLRQWKLSAMDLRSRSKWYAYSRARDQMLESTDSEHAPWHIVRSDEKRRARLNLIAHFLSLIPYEEVPRDKVELPKRFKKEAYDDVASIANRLSVPEKY